MERITDSERKAILKKYPDAWLKGTKHHVYLSGYEDSYIFDFLRSIRAEGQRLKPRPARKDGRQSKNRQSRRG